MKNKLFNRVVGVVLSSSIIFTGVISSPPTFAEESNSTQSKEQNSVTEEANYANFENGVGWNIDGTFKDDFRKLNFYPTNKQLKWGEKFGFIRP